MRRCDFSSVMSIIREYISEGTRISQPELICDLFYTFSDKNDDFEFDNGQINRWLKGAAPVSPRISEFYSRPSSLKALAADIETAVLPILYDEDMAAENIFNLVMNDISISEEKRSEITADYKNDTAEFIAKVLIFSMSCRFEKQDLKLTMGTLSPVANEMIFDGDLPKPCKYFCGRDNELQRLHDILSEHDKIFISGIAGIGKSEFAKAYGYEHRKDYTNILYLNYNDSLVKTIAEMDFADDKSDDDEQAKFKKHNRFLRSLKSDTLIIVDNFNTTAAKEPTLSVILKYNCKIIFTTRSRFEQGYTFELNEISDTETLIFFFGKFYSDTESERETVVKIIETVHSHTLSVELAARLLQKGISEPNEILEHLMKSAVNPETSDKIRINKDGINSKDTYYNHIRTLFSLFLLENEMQTVMRGLVFVSENGVRGRLFARWLCLSDMDSINELSELGFINNFTMDKISLVPMIREITLADLKPSVSNCKVMLSSLNTVCLSHGEDISYFKTLFSVIENICRYIEKDEENAYLLFIKNAFSYMEKYRYESGMHLIISELEAIKKTANDTALLYDFRSSLELLGGNNKKALELSKKAVSACVTEENYHLAANLNMNLGYCCHMNGDLISARVYMEQGIEYMKIHGEMNNDMVIMLHNYANLVSDLGEPVKAIREMKRCAELIKETNTRLCTAYADLYFDIGLIYIQQRNSASALTALTEAFEVYNRLLSETELTEKLCTASDFYKTAHISDIPDFLKLQTSEQL